ncbi:2OG-Fe(II) oxygenase [Sandaracinobacter sp. RS1-74]|uniref:prolyl hydroxylase family protein n=1 Tax=Sandaracinobacteroides sayramensis TaxID=2913411 RepID=UPI001EDC414C|nr:2OG-Fe(II) oxygenase [Sandaracinobacteroides sayramensis]MCG2839908.1 2OG-Fe(II) oxygenase [Sandaracinobacteroides sayramensis]
MTVALAENVSTAPFAGCQKFPGKALVLYQKKAFLDAATCAALVERIDSLRRPSTISDSNGDPFNRTSETADLFGGDPLIDGVNALLDRMSGQPGSHGEVLQGQRYAVGQEFKFHTDYFEPGGPDWEANTRVGGQRTWTLMTYLNQPDEGGATRFKRIGKIFQPEAGKLLAWCNLDSAGRPNYETLHAGMKVHRGTKYIITKWYRERRMRA